MKCPSCGASTPVDAVVCPYCETRLTSPEATSRAAIFERVRSSPAYLGRERPERLESLPKLGPLSKVIIPLFFGMFVLVSGFMVVMMVGAAGFLGFGFPGGFSIIPLIMAIVPIGFVVIGIAGGVYVWNQAQRADNAPLQTKPAIVTGKRTQVSGGRNSSASTHYFVTFEDESAQRQEHRVWDGNMYGRLSEGDAGVLFLRDDLAVDFDRVEV